MGCRDYAILMLLARLGLRAHEIRFLELDDIDWARGILRLRTKGGKRNTLPLSREVGDAVADDLRHGRPPCRSRRELLRVRSPIEEFRHGGGITCIVRLAIERAGVVALTFRGHDDSACHLGHPQGLVLAGSCDPREHGNGSPREPGREAGDPQGHNTPVHPTRDLPWRKRQPDGTAERHMRPRTTAGRIRP